jgi:hypothetical protein
MDPARARGETAAPAVIVAAPADASHSGAGCPDCCRTSVELSARLGLSVHSDQWLGGGQLRATLPCLGNLGIGPLLTFGVGGNHLTVRSAARLDYLFWLDRSHHFGIYPAAAAAVIFYVPMGHFAEFCHRVDLEECSGFLLGGEMGGGLRYRMFAVDAVAGFGGLPTLTIMAALAFPVGAQR